MPSMGEERRNKVALDLEKRQNFFKQDENTVAPVIGNTHSSNFDSKRFGQAQK